MQYEIKEMWPAGNSIMATVAVDQSSTARSVSSNWYTLRLTEVFIKQVHSTVRLGAKALDEKLPGWADKIDEETLDLSDPSFCVCGQLFEDEAALADFPDGYEFAVRTRMENFFHAAFPDNGWEDLGDYTDQRAGRAAAEIGFVLPIDHNNAENYNDDDYRHLELLVSDRQIEGRNDADAGVVSRITDGMAISLLERLTGFRLTEPSAWQFLTDMWRNEIAARQNASVDA